MAVVRCYTKYNGRWAQIWASKDFKLINITEQKFENHVRSLQKKIKQVNDRPAKDEREDILATLKRLSEVDEEEGEPDEDSHPVKKFKRDPRALDFVDLVEEEFPVEVIKKGMKVKVIFM